MLTCLLADRKLESTDGVHVHKPSHLQENLCSPATAWPTTQLPQAASSGASHIGRYRHTQVAHVRACACPATEFQQNMFATGRHAWHLSVVLRLHDARCGCVFHLRFHTISDALPTRPLRIHSARGALATSATSPQVKPYARFEVIRKSDATKSDLSGRETICVY